MNYNDKKILILGGANQHLKFVEAAKELGIYTIVTDYLKDSPCKQICDEPLSLNITDIDNIVDFCKQNAVDGIVSGFLDPCQIPYSLICEKLGLPCYGTSKQFYQFTNKKSFKALCRKNGVNVIKDYTIDDIVTGNIDYPVFVKPVDSRGSRGQTVCHSSAELDSAIRFAKEQSSNGDILIEQYMGDCDEVQITCFVVNGEIFLERTVDSHRGSEESHLQKVVNCSISPSCHTQEYLEKAHSLVCNMIRDLGIKNGPVFMQGFYKEGQFYFFDPGLRFPGVEFERIYKKVWGVDFAQILIKFSLTGEIPKDTCLPKDGVFLKGKMGCVFFPVIRKGKIKKILGIEKYLQFDNCFSLLSRYGEGEFVDWSYDVNQRFAEVDILGDNINDIIGDIDCFYSLVHVLDMDDNDMFFDKVNTKKIKIMYEK